MFRRLSPFWLFLIVFVVGMIYLPGVTKYLKLKRKETELTTEINRLSSDIKKLKEEEHLLKTDLTQLEKVVREELGLVRPGEIVVKVVEEDVPDQKNQNASVPIRKRPAGQV